MNRLKRLIALIGLGLALAGCSKSPVSPSITGHAVVELDRTPRWGFTWSPATGELLTMFGISAPALVAIDPETGAMRTIDPDGSDYRLGVSANGSTLFYNRNDPDSSRAFVVSLVPPGKGRPLATASRSSAFAFAAQAPAGLAAYGFSSGDSVTLHDLAAGERRQVAEGIPILFSPDGTRLVHFAATTGLQVLSGGTSTPAGLPRTSVYDFEYPLAGPRLRWDARGLRMLYVSEDHKRLMYVEPYGSPRTIAKLGGDGQPVWISRPSLVWSASGRSAAVWCTRLGERSGFWHDLYFIDVEARLGPGVTQLIAPPRVTTAQGITNRFVDGPLAISPDDSRLYADIDRTLYEFSIGR